MVLDLVRIVGGVVLLYFGADWLVKGAAGLARAFGIAPIVIGLTVVAYGTSAPELVVTIVAALEGKSAIALGNVVGSNIANIGVILALTAIIHPPSVDATLIRREVPVMVLAALAVPLVLLNGNIGRIEGIVFVVAAIAFTAMTLKTVQTPPAAAADAEYVKEAAEEVNAETGTGSKPKLTALAVVGLAALIVGGKVFVDGASGIALALGMSERVVGLTIVAVGTSLPELATSLLAALRGHSAIAVGNVVGSNIFNILLILGIGAAIRPIHGTLSAIAVDLSVMVAMTLVAAFIMRGSRVISRIEGTAMAAGYAAFVAWLVIG